MFCISLRRSDHCSQRITVSSFFAPMVRPGRHVRFVVLHFCKVVNQPGFHGSLFPDLANSTASTTLGRKHCRTPWKKTYVVHKCSYCICVNHLLHVSGRWPIMECKRHYWVVVQEGGKRLHETANFLFLTMCVCVFAFTASLTRVRQLNQNEFY